MQLVLKLENSVSDGNSFRLLLIASSLRDYQLAYFINLVAGLNLKKYQDLPVTTDPKQPHHHSWFQSVNEEDSLRYYLIENESNGKYLFPGLKKIDFLLFIKKGVSEQGVNDLAQKLRQVRGFKAVFKYEVSMLIGIGRFFDKMELHELVHVILPMKEPPYRPHKRGGNG